MPSSIRDNKSASRYELDVEGGVAFADYRLAPGVVTITYTEVPAQSRGRSLGAKLARAVLEYVRGEGLKIIPRCGFLASYIRAHAESHDLVAPK